MEDDFIKKEDVIHIIQEQLTAFQFPLRTVGSPQFQSRTAVPAGGLAGAGMLMSSTTNLGMFFGSGAPTLSAAKGSIYIRTDGSSASTRTYVNTDGSTSWTFLSAGVGATNIDVQEFVADGTWTKPASAVQVHVECWGGGASGGSADSASSQISSGGGGGVYVDAWFDADDLSATEAITHGDGGTAVNEVDGITGGETSFGTLLKAPGGIKGDKNPTNTPGGNGGKHTGMTFGDPLYGEGVSAGAGEPGLYSAAGGGGTGANVGGACVFGGGGGGGRAAAGGVSHLAGDGGAGVNGGVGIAGSDPSGGGGASKSFLSGKGGEGKCIATTYF